METDEHEEDFRSSLEALDEAFFRMTAVRDDTGTVNDFRYDYCNQAALRVLGRVRDDVIGRRLLELFPLHEKNGLFDAYVHVTETGEPLRYEFDFDENGVVGEFEVLVCRMGDGYVLVGHDISDRKRTERGMALVAEQLQSALTSRIVIEQAKGYLAASFGLDPDTAFLALRRHARDNNQLIGDVAAAVVAGDIDLAGRR